MGRLLTAHELAEALNLSVETIWRYTRQKKILFMELSKSLSPTGMKKTKREKFSRFFL